MKTDKWVAWVAVGLVLVEVVLVVVSWLLSATMTDGVRSLLTGEGIRWLLAHFIEGLQSPFLVWLLLVSLAIGCLKESSLLTDVSNIRRPAGMRVAFLLMLLYVFVVLLLTVFPHAVLLSATGSLWPSPFSRALVPILCLGVLVVSVGYGLVARTFCSLTQIVASLVAGLAWSAPLLLLYILSMQLYQSFVYVFR